MKVVKSATKILNKVHFELRESKVFVENAFNQFLINFGYVVNSTC